MSATVMKTGGQDIACPTTGLGRARDFKRGNGDIRATYETSDDVSGTVRENIPALTIGRIETAR
jgi:hypothetical protein